MLKENIEGKYDQMHKHAPSFKNKNSITFLLILHKVKKKEKKRKDKKRKEKRKEKKKRRVPQKSCNIPWYLSCTFQ